MTVVPDSINTADERPIEYGLLDSNPPVLLYRVEFGSEVLRRCTLGPNRELLYRLDRGSEPVEVTVVYHRGGYTAQEYDAQGAEVRFLLERSRAISCPSILSHLSGFKKVQQELARPGVLERFMDSPGEVHSVRETFARLLPLDDTQEGLEAATMARDPTLAANYILSSTRHGDSTLRIR